MGSGYKKVLLSILVLIIICLMTSVSYAFYEKNIKSQNSLSLITTSEILNVNYLDGKEYDLNNVLPNDVITKKISITNVSNKTTYITLSLMDVENTSSDIYISALDSNNQIIYDNEITQVDTDIIKTQELEAGKTISYKLLLTNKGDNSISNFYANILVYNESAPSNVETIKNTILKNNTPKDNALTNVGNEISNSDEGLIKTYDDDGEAYYFRGNVINNYVNFGGFMWRIIRINGNGSIRLMMQDALDNTIAYNTIVDGTDDYINKLNYANTDLKTKLESWLNNNLAENSNYITNSTFCSDNNVFKEENGVEYLNSYNRIFNDLKPSLICNGDKVSAKIGIISADEVTYAGAFKDSANPDYFLVNPNIKTSFWTMSGSQIITNNNVVDGIVVNNNGSLSYDKKISLGFAIRPVISLDKNTTITGDGTNNNPYIIKKQ